MREDWAWLIERNIPWSMVVAWIVIAAIGVACTTDPRRAPALSEEYVRTPEGYAEWKTQSGQLNQTMLAARDRYVREDSLDALKTYEQSVRDSLDHGFVLYRSIHADSSSREILDTLVPYLDRVSNTLMDVAEEYVKHRSTAMGNEIANEIITSYTDLPLLSAQQRANTLLFQNRYRRDF
jgi:hypothetical protein